MPDWVAWYAFGLTAIFFILAIGVRIIARGWYDEQRRHLRHMLGSVENSKKENDEDGEVD